MIFRRLRHAMVFCFFPSEPPESVKSKGTRGQRDALILEKQNHPHVFALGLKDAACKAPVLAPLLDRTRAQFSHALALPQRSLNSRRRRRTSQEPGCFILSACGALGGCTACWARKAVLEKYANGSGGGTGLSVSPRWLSGSCSICRIIGLDDYRCCQGYVGACCCVEPPECRGEAIPPLLPQHHGTRIYTLSHLSAGSPAALFLEGCCCPVFSLSIARIHLMDKKQAARDWPRTRGAGQ